jgi:hypothetical protein
MCTKRSDGGKPLDAGATVTVGYTTRSRGYERLVGANPPALY